MAITKATASAVAPAAKGDLVVGSATNDAAVLGVGTDGQYLTAASTTATGLQWSTLSAGGMTLLSTTTLSGTTTTVSGISGSYTDLIILVQGAVFGTGGSNIRILVNGSTSNIYGSAYFNDNGSAVALNMSNEMIKGLSDALNTGGNNIAFVRINNYANTSYYKAFTTSSGGDRSPAGQKGGLIGGGVIQTTSAITSIGVSTANSYTFSGGQLLIYGVK